MHVHLYQFRVETAYQFSLINNHGHSSKSVGRYTKSMELHVLKNKVESGEIGFNNGLNETVAIVGLYC